MNFRMTSKHSSSDMVAKPRLSTSAANYRLLLFKASLRGLLIIAASFVLLLLAPTWIPDNASSGARRTGEGYAGILLILPIYGIYYLLTIQQRVNKKLRQKIFDCHPELQKSEDHHKSSLFISPVTLTVLITLAGLALITYYVFSLIAFSKS